MKKLSFSACLIALAAVPLVTANGAPPTLESASGSNTFTTVRVVFSEPLDEASAETAGNYALSGGITVSEAALAADADTVVLTTSRQPEGTVLTLTVNNVKDAFDNAIAADSTIEFKTHVWVSGAALVKKWNNFTGNNGDPAIAIDQNLLSDPRFPDNPDEEFVVTFWEYPPNGAANASGVSAFHNNYASQITGWFTPEETDNYVFFTVSDDPSKLYLSPDDDPANKLLIAQQIGWAPVRAWQDDNQTEEKNSRRSDFFENAEWEDWTANGGIRLEAGERYYMESLHTEGGGGDNVAVTYLTEQEAVDDPDAPANGTVPRLTGNLIGAYFNPNGIEVTITQQPQDATVLEDRTATFTVEAEGTHAYGNSLAYQWQSADASSSDFADIEGATAASYTTDILQQGDSGRHYRVVIGAPIAQLYSVNSDATTLTVNPDEVPPTLESASGSDTFTTVRVVFSEPLDEASAETAGNYALSGGITVSEAALAADADTVVLTTSRQPEGTVLTLTVNNVQDAAGNNAIAADSTIEFKTHVWISGFVLYKRWDQIDTRVSGIGPHSNPDKTFRDLETLADFPDNPDVVSIRPLWEAITDGNELNEYAAQIVGWISPAETDSYVFFTNSDDPSHLYLSPDNDPANKLLIAQQVQWSGARQWHHGNPNSLLKRSDEFPNEYPNDVTGDYEYDIWPDDGFTSNGGIPLEAGNRYYMESVHREGGGGGNVQATMITEDKAGEEGFPANGTASTLTGNLIGAYFNPNGIEVTITNQPSDATVISGRTTTFSVVAGATSTYGNAITYQWQSAEAGSSDFADIEGAIAASYTTDILQQGDSGRQYRVVIGAPVAQLYSVNSDAATLTVSPDEVLPEIVSVFPLQRNNVVVVLFNERLDESSAETAGNYTISGASVSAAGLVGDGGNVVNLTVSGTPSADFTVTATGVQDFSGNAITSSEGVAVTSDVVVYWDFNDASNENTVTDLVRSATGELTGGASYTDDRGGRTEESGDRAIDFGSYGNGQYVLVDQPHWLNGYPSQLDQITIAFWQRWEVNIANQSIFWLASESSDGGQRGASAHTPWDGTVYFDTVGCCDANLERLNSNDYSEISENPLWEEWTHFAFLKDGPEKEIWINGELFHWSERQFPDGGNAKPFPSDFYRLVIGANGSNNDLGLQSHGGLVDDFAIFATPLSQADIEQLADGMRPDEIRTIVPIVDPPTGLSISVRLNNDGTVTLEFTGTLHSSDSITGMFEPVDGAASPYTVPVVAPTTPPTPGQPMPEPSAVDPQKFYLVR